MNSLSSAGDSSRRLAATSTSHLPRSESAAKTRERKGRSAGLFSRIRFRLWGRKEKQVDRAEAAEDDDNEEGIADGDGVRRYSYDELHAATEGFNPKKIIGKGGSGVVYGGILKDEGDHDGGIDVAVKMIVGGSEHRRRDYVSEIRVIGRLRHPNLVRLLGYCHEGEHLLLVHEFMPNGGLSSHLYRPELRPLPWDVRYNRITAGLTLALSYLQTGWERCVVHRDIKPSNILLDAHFNPKLTDFELARIADDRDSDLDITNVVAGTMGYLAPEFVVRGKFSKESDIYAFGVVLLELACGRRPVDRSRAGRVYLMQWLRDLDNKGKILEAADPRLGGAFNKQEMKRMLSLGLMCTHDEPDRRPSIGEILKNFKHSTMPPPREFSPKEEISNVGMMPYFLSDVEDYTTICFELSSTAAAATPANIVASEASGSIASLSDNEPASRASSGFIPSGDPAEWELEVDFASQRDVVQRHQQLELETEHNFWDIGIPADYLSAAASPAKGHHHPVINGFAASLHNLLQSEDSPLRFDEVLKSIRVYTACLVSVGAPLVQWNELAQRVLRVSKMMDAFPSLIASGPTTAATLSSLRANVSEGARAAHEHESRSESVRKQLKLARTEYFSLMSRIAELEKQIEESETELKSMAQTAAQHREFQEKLSTILDQYEETLSELSSFTCT